MANENQVSETKFPERKIEQTDTLLDLGSDTPLDAPKVCNIEEGCESCQ